MEGAGSFSDDAVQQAVESDVSDSEPHSGPEHDEGLLGEEIAVGEQDEGEWEDEEEDEEEEIIRGKWMLDDCESIAEIVLSLRKHAAYMRGLKQEGWELTDPVQSDWGFLRRVDHL